MAALSLIHFVLGTVVLGLSAPADRPKPGEVIVNQITYTGTGCPLGSVADSLSEDDEVFTLLFDQFTVETGPTIDAKREKKNCRIVVDMRVPPGWTYTVARADFRGYANVEKGAVGEQRSNLYFRDKGPVLTATFTGPVVKDYLVTNDVGPGEHPWQNCKKPLPLTIDTQILVRSPQKRRALLTVDSLDGRVKHKYRLRFRRCKADEN